ncbi:hypothetical protein T440DRAFT_15527 [Plenodomus tracheiphilus IPT5]|uniref:Uncharacterized protein n=1 Tax=Plenodomus tracheiphilus IPT5 TaxID=1408161 RepID=A0A6A7BNS0_9PLEO|nr:hypothetical protein T440DRAFT_15527 [Plenodomus tracheiphilus IPT5]
MSLRKPRQSLFHQTPRNQKRFHPLPSTPLLLRHPSSRFRQAAQRSLSIEGFDQTRTERQMGIVKQKRQGNIYVQSTYFASALPGNESAILHGGMRVGRILMLLGRCARVVAMGISIDVMDRVKSQEAVAAWNRKMDRGRSRWGRSWLGIQGIAVG